MRDVPLEVPLRLLTLRRRGQRHHPTDAGVQPLRDPLDHAPLSRSVTPLEDDDDLQALVLDPFLQLDQLHLELGELLLVFLVLQLLRWL